MSKSHKKRTKRYQGEDAAQPVQRVVQHYTAVQRGPLREWWLDNKRRIRFGAIVAAIVLVVGYLLFELINIFV